MSVETFLEIKKGSHPRWSRHAVQWLLRALWIVVVLHPCLSVTPPSPSFFHLPLSLVLFATNSSWLRRLSPIFPMFSLPTLPWYRG